MAFPVSHKTIFVLDHSPYFETPCRQNVEFDIFTKTRQPGIIPLAPISKSLWTSVVESAVEYCRIVWDIFPTGKLVRFVVSDTGATFLNKWSASEQNVAHLMSRLAEVGAPTGNIPQQECNILHGLTDAIEALCECTEIQHEKRTSFNENAGRILNKGRVICLTSVKSDVYVRSLEECFLNALLQHNKRAAGSDDLMPINLCQLVILHVHPLNEESTITSIPARELASVLVSEVHSIKGGRHLSAKLGYLVQQHYDLASTTVTGIPMKKENFPDCRKFNPSPSTAAKPSDISDPHNSCQYPYFSPPGKFVKEEQNANSSANYDVELFHPSSAHSELIKTGLINTEGVQMSAVKEGLKYDTIMLKWCTPRTNTVELHYCTGAVRITPVDVNSRPSSCLTNFLLGGRAVMLEMPRKSGSKVMSHMLTSHGGEIHIHTLLTGRSILEDPPSISEGCGGRVTDYRITDFGEFMKENRLVPCKLQSSERDELPIEKAKARLLRLTQYWPMVISHTTIFNMTSQLDPLLSLITKETLTPDECIECKKVIYQLVTMENKGAALPVPTIGTRGKGPRREEQYRTMWNELETFVRVHCLTAEHRSVLECLLECRKPSSDSDSGMSAIASGSKTPSTPGTPNSSATPKKADKLFIKEEKGDVMEIDSGKMELESKLLKFGEREKAEFIKDDIKPDPFKLPPLKKFRPSPESSGPQTLLSLWTNKVNSEHRKQRLEFAGRAAAGNGVAKLYPSLSTESNNSD